jgi:hypothetical protein
MHKNYYAIIPAEVRYNEKLTPNAKLLYGEITALCNEKGYCWATNKYFSDLYKVSDTSVSKWVGQLIDQAFIRTEINQDGKRIIYIIGLEEKLKGALRKVKGGVEEKLKPYNILYNITNNTNNNKGKNRKSVKKFKDFHPLLQKAYFATIELFPEETRPKTTDMKRKWLQELEDLWRIDNYNPRKVYLIILKVRMDDFWKDKFLTILKLRRRNKDKIKYIEYFDSIFGQHLKTTKFEKYKDV